MDLSCTQPFLTSGLALSWMHVECFRCHCTFVRVKCKVERCTLVYHSLEVTPTYSNSYSIALSAQAYTSVSLLPWQQFLIDYVCMLMWPCTYFPKQATPHIPSSSHLLLCQPSCCCPYHATNFPGCLQLKTPLTSNRAVWKCCGSNTWADVKKPLYGVTIMKCNLQQGKCHIYSKQWKPGNLRLVQTMTAWETSLGPRPKQLQRESLPISSILCEILEAIHTGVVWVWVRDYSQYEILSAHSFADV